MGIGALNYQGVKGGLKLNDVIEEFKYAYKGQEIKAGDFVNYIEGVAGQTTETSVDTRLDTSSYSGNKISAVALDENRVFIAHRYTTNSDLYGMVVTINGATIIAGTHTVIRQTNSADAISAVALDSSKVLIAHNSGGGANAHLRVTVCTIDGTTITANSTKELSSSTYTGSRILAKLLPSGNVFIAHSYGSNYQLYGIVCTVSGTTISNGTDTAVNASDNAGNAISTCLLPNGNIFIAHSYGSSYYLYGIVCSINGTTITKGNDTAIEKSTSYSGGSDIFTVVLPNNNVFIAHRSTGQVYLYGIVCTIDGSLVFVNGTDTIINNSETYTGARISAVALDDARVFIAHSYSSSYYLYAVVVTINGTTVTVGTDTTLNAVTKSGNTISTLLLQNGTIFIAHSYNSDSYLYAQIWGVDEVNNIPTNEIAIPEYEQQVTLATEPPFDGIALSSGVGGDDTGHNQQVKIAKPTIPLSSLPVGSLVKDTSSTFLGEPVIWKVADVNHEGYPDNSVTLITDKIVALRCFDAKEPSNSNYERQTSGNNRYSVSNIRQWLNSDAEAGQWYTAQHSVDQAPNSDVVAKNAYADDEGFLNGFSEKFKNALLSTSLKVGLNQLDGGGSETVTDKIFLASATELGVQAALAPAVEGIKLSLFNDGTNIPTTVTAKCVEDNEYENENIAVGLNWRWWLRTGTTNTDDCDWVCLINNTTSVTSASVGSASGYEIGIRPLCNFPSSIKVSSTPDEDGCYNIIF